jgi:nitrate/TMAO reductase-like tetraheme cytochrome c subunit
MARRHRVFGLGVGLVIALGLVALAISVEVSSTPSFCGSCHVMTPYFESWKTSTHAEVPCVDCHIPPGVTAEFRKKYEAMSMVTRYFTGTYSTNPWAEVDDQSCLRCHEKRLLVAEELFEGILFDHAPHLTQLRRGKRLRCTSCHSQIVQGSHISVTTSTCILCHFKGERLGTGTSRCTLCHEVPTTVVEHATFRFDHSDVIRFDMDCEGCHGTSVRGEGNVPPERCLTCHNEPDRLSELENVELLHQMHVTDHKVECTNCHLEIEHGIQTDIETLSSDCRSCHHGGHSPQQQLYAGIGGRGGIDPMPSAMYLAGIRCEGCHIDLPGHEGQIPKASDIACMSCHGPKYRDFYFQWKASVDQRTRAVGQMLRQSEPLFQRASPQAYQDALHNFHLVEEGHGVHNVAFTFRLLDRAVDLLNDARSDRNAPALSKPWPDLPYDSACFGCHEGVESRAARVFDRRFDHSRHVIDSGIACESCHLTHEDRTGAEHLRFGAEGCSSCHHPDEGAQAQAECQSCHETVFSRSFTTDLGDFPHQLHVEDMEMDCLTCHEQTAEAGFVRSAEVCMDCH